MKKRLLSGLIGLLAAQPALSMDLVETYEKALSYDSGIASAQAQFQAQQAAVDASKSSLLPQITATGSVNHTDFAPHNAFSGSGNEELARQFFSGDSSKAYSYGVEWS